MLKLIGLSLILAASGAVGAGLAGTVRRQQAQTLALIDAVLRIRHELQYRLTPLPEIFAGSAAAGSASRGVFRALRRCCPPRRPARSAMPAGRRWRSTRGLCLSCGAGTMMSLFDSLGKYDPEGAYRRSIWRCPACGRR